MMKQSMHHSANDDAHTNISDFSAFALPLSLAPVVIGTARIWGLMILPID